MQNHERTGRELSIMLKSLLAGDTEPVTLLTKRNQHLSVTSEADVLPRRPRTLVSVTAFMSLENELSSIEAFCVTIRRVALYSSDAEQRHKRLFSEPALGALSCETPHQQPDLAITVA